jgi:hypothetical protein
VPARAPWLTRLRLAGVAALCAVTLTGCGLDLDLDLPLPGLGEEEQPVDGAAALTDWKQWEPPATERTVGYAGGPWTQGGHLARTPDVCGLLTTDEVRAVVPRTASVTLDPTGAAMSGADTGATSCRVLVDSDAIPENVPPYSFVVDMTVAEPETLRPEVADARVAALAGSDPQKYGEALGGSGAWAGGHRLVLHATPRVLVQMRSIGRTNGAGWTVPAGEFGTTSSAEVAERWRQAVFTKLAKVLTGKLQP